MDIGTKWPSNAGMGFEWHGILRQLMIARILFFGQCGVIGSRRVGVERICVCLQCRMWGRGEQSWWFLAAFVWTILSPWVVKPFPDHTAWSVIDMQSPQCHGNIPQHNQHHAGVNHRSFCPKLAITMLFDHLKVGCNRWRYVGRDCSNRVVNIYPR